MIRARYIDAMADAPTPVDGRTARRDRNRAAVIEAHLDLVLETGQPPTPDAVASRSGVSMSSLFRYFDTLEDLQHQAVAAFFERYGTWFEITDIGEGTTKARIDRFVTARLRLHNKVAPIARLTRVQAQLGGPIATDLQKVRASLATQVHAHFAPELSTFPRHKAERRADSIDALTSFEAFDLLQTGHERSTKEIRETWTITLRALLTPGT